MTDPAFAARREISAAVHRLTEGLGDPRSAVHDPLAALAAAVSLRAALAQTERDAARRAREDGRLWSEIGEAAGMADRPQPGMTSVAEHAFGRFASDLGDGPVFSWRCPSCGALVADRGPEQGGPSEAESGHADGCGRFAALVRAWDASWDDGSEEESRGLETRP